MLTKADIVCLLSLCEFRVMEVEADARRQARDGLSMASVRQLLWEADQIKELMKRLKAFGDTVDRCSACGFPNNPDGTCSRSQCCNSE